MSPQNTKSLFEAFPYLYRGRCKSAQESSMHFGFECGDGWYDLLWRLSASIEDQARKLELSPPSDSWPEVFQVKQKAGLLCFYIENATPAIEKIIEEAVKLASQTCEVCGAQGAQLFPHPRTTKVLCSAHALLAPAVPQKVPGRPIVASLVKHSSGEQ